MPFSLYLQQSAVSNAQLKQYASTAQLFDMVKWTKEAYNHFGVPYFDTCCQAEPFNIDLYISDDAGNMMSLGADGKLTVSVVTIAANLVSAQAGNNIIVSSFDNKLWAPQVSGIVYATGTTNYIAKFQGATSLIDSTLFEYITASGTTIVVNGTTSQKVAIQDNGISANNVLPNFTTSSPSGYSAIGSQVLDGSRNRRVSQFINDTLALWGHSVIYSTGTIPTYGIWQGLNRTLSIAPTGNVIIRTSSTSSDFTDTGYKLDVFGSLRTNSTVNFTGVANTTTSNVLYYDNATGAVTYGTTPAVTLNSSGTAPYYMLMYDTANNLVKSTNVWTGSSQQTLLLDGAPSSVTGSSYPQPLLIRQWSDYTGSNPSLYPGFDIYNLLPGGAGTNGIGAGLNFRTYYKGGYAGIYSQSLTDSNSNLRFYVTNAGAKTDAIHISSNTYVGIGTTAPTAQLHVSGTTKLQGIPNTVTANTLYYNSSTGAVTYGASTASTGPIYYIANTQSTTAFLSAPISGTVNGANTTLSFTPTLGKSYNVKVMLVTYDAGTQNSPSAPGLDIGTSSTSSFDVLDCSISNKTFNGYEYAYFMDTVSLSNPNTFSSSATVSGSTYGANFSKVEINLNLYNCSSVGTPVSILYGVKNAGQVYIVSGNMIVTQLN